MSKPRIISIVPYKILPAKLGGEKGIAVFNEYVGVETEITAVSTKNNEIRAAKNYQMLPWLPNSRMRYVNIFLYFRIRQLIKEGAEVKVIMTPLAKEFISPLTLATLAKNPVLVDFFEPTNGDWHSQTGRLGSD